MPYISKEKVSEIRKELKNTFPKVKFSITKRHSSTVCINIMESPYKWSKSSMDINHYYPENHENPEFLIKVLEIAKRDKKMVSLDSDYGAIPNFYVNIEVGKWDKPHVKRN